MTAPIEITLDESLDLVLERKVDVPPALVWRAWTEPELLKQWFCPKPWAVTECEIDLRPGGKFYTLMQGPDGEKVPGTGCYLDIIPERRIVWTDCLGPGFRPSEKPFMTGMVELSAIATGTAYRAIARHADPESRKKHADMGFADGWGAAWEQLVELVGTL